MTREQEEARLEAAMQRGDELLVNSLRNEERHRRRTMVRIAIVAAVMIAAGIVMTQVAHRLKVQRQIADVQRRQAAAAAANAMLNAPAAITTSPATSNVFLPSPATQPTADWPAALAGLSDDNWRRAFALGTELARLSPQQAWPIVEANWSKIPNFEARQQILKAFAFARLHPRVLDVMHLGMTDPEPQVRAWAAGYLRGLAYQDFAENSAAYEQWRSGTAKRPVTEVVAQSAGQWISALRELPRDEVKQHARFVREVRNDLSQTPAARDAAISAGALALGRCWVTEYSDDPDIVVAGRDLLAALKPDEKYLKAEILPLLDAGSSRDARRAAVNILGRADNKWAVDPLLAVLRESVTSQNKDRRSLIWDIAQALAEIGDPRAIPDMIAAIAHDNTYDTVYGVGYFGLGKMTGVRYDESHNGQWWRQWWERERQRFPEPARSSPIPTLDGAGDKTRAAQSDSGIGAPIYAMIMTAAPAGAGGMTVEDLRVTNDGQMRYFLMGPKVKAAPKDGYRLLLVLPGGDGGADFRPFIESVAQESVSDQYLVAQLVAPKWAGSENIVWPKEKDLAQGAPIATEKFIDAVVEDVAARFKLDARHVYALGWSSSGPPVYATAMRAKTPLSGAFVAMSVFKANECPPAAGAKGRPFYILHSPQDFIKMTFPEAARKTLTAAGARVKLQTYQGGHGWHGDPQQMIRAGVTWLESQSKSPATRATSAPTTTTARPRA